MSGVVSRGRPRGPGLSPLRMDSCVRDPQMELLLVFQERNLRAFVDTLSDDSVDVNKEYPLENHQTILQLVVTAGSEDFLRELLRHPSTDPNIPHQVLRKFPLHSACERGLLSMARLLLASGADPNARMENGNTPLHIAALRSSAKWAQGGGEEQSRLQAVMLEVVQLLLAQDNIHYDLANNLGVTPLYQAAEKGTEGVVRALLKQGACLTTLVDGKTAEQWIMERMPGLLDTPGLNTAKNRQNKDTPDAVLFKTLYSSPKDFAATLDRLTKAGSVDLDSNDGSYTLLQYCCDLGYADLADLLLAAGARADHVGPHNKMPAVVWAAHHGYHLVLRVFKRRLLDQGVAVDFSATDTVRKETVLHKVLKAESKAYSNREQRKYSECLKLLLDDESPTFQRSLAGAINAQDNMGNTPLHVAAQMGNHEAVRKLLRCGANLGLKNWKGETPIVHIAPTIMEEYLDDCLEGEGLTTDDKFKITFKYHFLGPPKMREEDKQPLLGGKETEAPTRRELPETEPLWYMAQIPEHRHLMAHPTITSFLWMKWRRVRPYFYLNLSFYILFVALLTAYVLHINTIENPSEDPATAPLFWATLVFLVIFTLRELFQLAVSYRKYLFNIENLMEVSLVVLTFLLLLGSHTDTTSRHLSGLVILLSWAEGVLLIGGHPRLSTYITMFKEVSFNFGKFLTWFISLIIAFGLCFFIIFQRKGAKDEDGEELNAHFVSPEMSLMKTIIISLTGEIEFEGIDFSSEFSRIIFLVYVFFIMLVLVNLLNGLAIVDIAETMKHSEILSHISRVELMCHIESILLGDPFQFLGNFPESRLARKLPDCNLLASLYRLSCIERMLGLFGSRRFLLFSSRLSQKQAVFLPNRSKKEQSVAKGERNDLVLSNQILEAAKGLIVRKQTETEEQETRRRLEKMEKSLLLVAQQQNHIIELLAAQK